jgi:hypothetical protein
MSARIVIGAFDLTVPHVPMAKAPHPADPLAPDVGGKDRTQPVPPQPNRLMPDVDAAFEQQVFDIPQRQRNRTYIDAAPVSAMGGMRTSGAC